jgi:L-aminopeptidase/D-esterase-like protein
MPVNQTLTALPGVRVGHWTNPVARTGCTVILMPPGGAVASGEVRGGAPGTRETALLEPSKSVEKIHAIVFSGGSAFGLATATGVMGFLEALGEGVKTPHACIPIVPAAVIYDLGSGDANFRPGPEAGLAAAKAASSDAVPGGLIGAGAGAMTGKYLGFEGAQPGGLGNARLEVGGVMLSALVVANPHGDVIDANGNVISGARKADGSRPEFTEILEAMAGQPLTFLNANTTLVALGTNAKLSKLECFKLAQAAQIGIARASRPSHTPFDGDTAFAFSVGDDSSTGSSSPSVPLPALITAGQAVVAMAMRNAVLHKQV